MNKITDKLKEIDIHNDYEIALKGHPIVGIHRRSGYRDVTPYAVTLAVKGSRFKNQPYYQFNDKWFTYLGKEGRDKAYQEAFAWIAEYFPGMKMVKSPFDQYNYVPEEDLKKIYEKAGIKYGV